MKQNKEERQKKIMFVLVVVFHAIMSLGARELARNDRKGLGKLNMALSSSLINLAL